MFGLIGGLLAGALGLGGVIFGAKAQKQSYDDNLAMQQQQFAYQVMSDQWNRNFAIDNEVFNRNAFQQQIDLAKAPVSTVVKDGMSVGVNPMAALGQSSGSSSYSSTSAPSSGASVSPVSLQDGIMTSLMNSLTSLASTKMNNDTTEKIADKQATLKQQELDIIDENNRSNIGLSSERNEIARLEANIHQQLANANDRMSSLEFQKFAHQKTKDIKTYILEKAKFQFSKYFSNKEFAQRVTEFNKRFDELIREFDKQIENADKDRRMQYITRLSNTAGRLAGSLFGVGSFGMDNFDSNYQDTKIGF